MGFYRATHFNMKRVCIKVKHTDDYRAGPSLLVLDNEEEEEEEYEDLSYEIDDTHFFVYHAQLNQCGCGSTVKLLKQFDDFTNAETFAKKMYQKITGDGPFIQDGIGEGYHPTGKRARYDEEEENLTLSLEDDDDEDEPYLLIVSKDTFEAHSLNPFAVW